MPPRSQSPLEIRRIKDLTDAHIHYFAEHPDHIDWLADRESFALGRMLWVLLAAIALVATSKLLAETYANEIEQMISNVLVDLVFEMGAALIGSVATVIFLEGRRKRQYTENLRLRFEIERRIALLDPAPPTKS